MKHRSLRVFGVAFVGLLSCKGEPERMVQTHVRNYCGDFANELEAGAEQYAKLAPGLDSAQASPDQMARADVELAASAVGVSRPAQIARKSDLYKRLAFCASVRKIDVKQRDEILLRYTTASNPITSERTHVEKARALGEMARIAREVEALPLRE